MKRCSKCKIKKELSNFYVSRTRKSGYHNECIECVKKRNNKRPKSKTGNIWKQSLHLEGLKYCELCEKVKDFSEFGKNKNNSIGLQNYCKPCKREKDKEYRQSLKDKGVYKKRKKSEYLKNRDQYRVYGLKYNKIKRDYQKEYKTTLLYRERNPLAKLKNILRNRILIAIKNQGYKKNIKTKEILGAEWSVVENHISQQFTEGMSWGNHGEWHIDHIIPLKTAKNKEELIKLNHYSNLQPLWATTREINGVVYEGNLNKG